MISTKPAVVLDSYDSDVQYETFSQQIRQRFAESVNKPMFTTATDGLFDLFLAGLPAEHRQHYTCNACRQFVNRFGGLVTISKNGVATPVMWPDVAPKLFDNSVEAMRQAIKKASITGVFLHGQGTWGTPVTGEWHHMSVINAPVYRHSLKTPSQAMAEKAEDFGILKRSLDEFNQATVEQAVTLLKTESLYRSEKCLGVAEWLLKLHQVIATTRNTRLQDNLIWLAVAAAPAGYCHVRSSMIGTLLDDIASGMDFNAVSRRFAEKMNPLQYQRPQAAPTAGNIAQAEKLVDKLGIQRSLLRRFARLDEIQALWKPKAHQETQKSNGVFSHLKPKGTQPEAQKVNLPAITMTWEKFQRTVLPTADMIEFFVPGSNNSYTALVTAVDMDAPPILQWDSVEYRNPVSWYLYHNGSHALRWGLESGKYCAVNAVCLKPSQWTGDFAHQGEGAIFVLNGAKDTGCRGTGSALFPEILKAELREVRSVIEAHSKTVDLAGYEESTASGIALFKGDKWNNPTFRVTSGSGVIICKLDRWD